jgi:hypothetical protein
MVAAGKSAAEIQAELEKRAGGNLSGIPRRQTSWAVPVLLALAAGLLLFFIFSRLKPTNNSGPTSNGGKKKRPTDGRTPEGGVDDERLARELEDQD